MNKWLELLVGLVLVVGSIYVAFYSATWFGQTWDFWAPAGAFFKGGLFWAVFLFGFLFILLGISDLKG